jgi:hypothetical protein
LKKGCLIGVATVALLLLLVGAVVLFGANRSLGLVEAPIVGHNTVASSSTRFRAVIEVDRLLDHILSAIPAGTELPSWVPMDIEELLPKILPREIAVVGGSDYDSGKIGLTLFINERRGGPRIQQYINESFALQKIELVQWAPEGILFPNRGILQADGEIAIPDGLEDVYLERWRHDMPGSPFPVKGGHLFELALDNRNGEVLTLMGAITEANGGDWQRLFSDPQVKGFLDLLVYINHGRITADLLNKDTLQFDLRIDAESEISMGLEFFTFALPQIKQTVAQRYGLVLEGDAKWHEDEEALIGSFKLKGIEKKLQQYLPRFQEQK